MGRKSRSKKQDSEASATHQIHNEEAQQGEPIDPDQEQVILPDPEEQDDPEPDPQQEEIHQDPPVDPIPDPSQEEQETHQDSEDEPEQNQEQEEIHQNLQKHHEQEEVCKEPKEDQRVHQAPNVEVEEKQEILIAESDTEDHHEEVQPLPQKSFKREMEPPTGILLASQEFPEQETEAQMIHHTSEESQATEVKTQTGVPSVSQESTERQVQRQAVGQPVLLESPSKEVEKQARTNPVSSDAPEQEIEIDVPQEQSYLMEENSERFHEAYPSIVPTVSNFQRLNFDEARGEILEQDHQNIHLASSSLLSLRRLLGLEEITDFPALKGPNLIAPQPTQYSTVPEHIPLLSFQESSTMVPLTEVRDNETEMRSELRIGEDLEQADRSETSQRHAEAPEALAVGLRKPMKARPRKHKKRKEPSKPEHADAIEYQELLDYENPPIEDPGEPDFADPRELLKLIESENAELSSPDELDFSDLRELLKDQNFGEMKADNQETKLAGNLKLETIVNLETEDDDDLKTEVSGNTITELSGNLETEGGEDLKTEGDSKTEVDENLETEADTYLETEEEDLEMENYEDLEMDNHGDVAVEVCEPPLPPAGRPPPEDGNLIPDDLEDSPSASLPNDEGNSPTDLQSQSESEESIRERREGEDCNKIIARCVISAFGIAFVVLSFLSIISPIFYLRDKAVETQNETTPTPNIDLNLTSINNKTS